VNLHLVLTNHWYDETAAGRKRVEYRSKTIVDKGTLRERPSKWIHQIWQKRHQIKTVTFSRGMTPTTQRFAVAKIDMGPCPIPGWAGEFIRIHFTEEKA
jgi:hypothetical protein